MRRKTFGSALRFVTVIALGSLIGVFAVAAPVGAATQRLGHDAQAYGTSAKLSSLFTSSPTALTGLGCTNLGGILHTASAASGGLLTAGFVGALNNSVATTGNGTSGSAQVGSVSLFSSLITADSFTVTASVTHDDSGFTFAGDTVAGDLSINGSPMSAPAPNTVIPLPGLGTLTVNEQITTHDATSATITVNALHLAVNAANAFNFPVGTDVIVGHVKAGLTTTPTRYVDGQGYGTQVQGTGFNAAREGLIYLPCEGTNGHLRTHSLASVSVPGVVSTGTQKSTVTGFGSKNFATATTTDTIQNVTLISLVSVDSLKAVANAQSSGKTRTFNDTGSTFGPGLSVLGVPVAPDSVKPNTQYAVPGLGTLYLHRVITTSHHIEVRMIELVVSVNTGTLPVGTDIRMGVAEASIHAN